MTDHRFKFARIGGVDQVVLRHGRDLLALKTLDQKLWVALTCPTQGLELDERTLSLIDDDNDGRIHAGELLSAIAWIDARVRDMDILMAGDDALPLSALRDDDGGALLKATARTMLVSLDKSDDKALTVTDAIAAVEKFSARALNGDGIVHPDSLVDEALSQLASDIVACTEAPTDRSGALGVSADSLAAFQAELAAHAAWLDAGDESTRPLGDDTAAAHTALEGVRGKVDDFFSRCRIAAFDPRALDAVNRDGAEYATLAAGLLGADTPELAHFPIAHIGATATLPLGAGINPAWSAAVHTFASATVAPMLGEQTELTEAQWRDICGRFAARDTWLGEKAGETVEALGEARVRTLLAVDALNGLTEAIAADAALADQAAAVDDVEKLVRLNRDLVTLANNFVAFRDFYDRSRKAVFQAGTLYFDQRACELVLPVLDAGRHAKMASKSNGFLAYCDCVNAKGEKRIIVAVVTGGDVDNIFEGRNGLFYDRKNAPWAATVTKIIASPISIRQAFWSPYKRALRFIEEQVEKRVADADNKAAADQAASMAPAKDAAAKGGAPAPPKTKIDVGMVAAIGVAIGGLVAAVAAISNSLFGLGMWMPLGILAIILAISLPSMAIAWLKLRRRNLGPLLDANGWAVNAMAKVNVPLGESLTPVAKLPKDAERELTDPYAEKRSPWWLYLLIALLLVAGGLWVTRNLDSLLPVSVRAQTVLGGDNAAPKPAATPKPAAAPTK